MSALPSTSDLRRRTLKVRKVPILLQKSQRTQQPISRQGMKRATIADQYSLEPSTRIACEFGARRPVPPHHYSIAASTGRRIESHLQKRLLQQYLPTTDSAVPRLLQAKGIAVGRKS